MKALLPLLYVAETKIKLAVSQLDYAPGLKTIKVDAVKILNTLK